MRGSSVTSRWSDSATSGLGLYSYRYLWSDTVYVGVMAQEVALIHPDAVVRSGGWTTICGSTTAASDCN